VKGKREKAQEPPRDRIVGTARNLFHELGFRGVGVDTIAEEAGTNKMTLYRHFDSKDDLIVECLRYEAEEGKKFFKDIEAQHPNNPRAQLDTWINYAAEELAEDCRGCNFSNASVELTDPEHPARRVIEEFKAYHRAWIAGVCKGSGSSQPELLADTLTTLLDGARVARQSDQNKIVDFPAMAAAIIASFKAQS
jgi:AcrR family transcriptional regulator